MWVYLYSTGETDIKQVNLNSMLCDDLEEWNGGGVGGGLQREVIYVHLSLIHIVVQKLTQNCKAIILQWKKQ